MEALKQLIEIGLSSRMDKIETFHPYQEDHNSMSYKLYNGIKDGSFNTEEEAAKALYNEKPDGSKFNMLKKRLKDRLYNTMFFLKPIKDNHYNNNSYVDNLYYCYKHFAIAKLLVLISANKAGFQLLERVLVRAQEYAFHDITLFCALTKRTYTLQSGNETAYKYYNDIYGHTLKLIQAEAEGEELYQSVLFHFATKISYKKEVIEEAETKAGQLKTLRDQFKTYQLYYQHFYLSLVTEQLKKNYRKAMVLCDEYEVYINANKKFLSRVRYANFLLLKMGTAQYLEDEKIVKECFDKALQLYPANHSNWFMLHEIYFALLLKKGLYNEAAEVMKAVQGNKKNFSDMPMRNQEIWAIYQGYLWLVLTLKRKTGLRDEIFQGSKYFKLGKFMNEVPEYKKDKQGFNISVLILQVLIFYTEGKDAECVKRAESLKQYVFKHLLPEDESYRNQLFIRMLIRAAAKEFDFKRLENDTLIKRWLEKLKAKAPDFTPTQNRIEVIPYEEVWQWTVNSYQ